MAQTSIVTGQRTPDPPEHPPLRAYPFPEGMVIPRLMPFQEFPFNGDHFLAAEVLRLKEAHGLTKALETGTCLGSTTLWLAEHFRKVWTCEVSDHYYQIACARFAAINGVHAIADNTDRFYTNIIARKRDSTQAMWNDADRVDFIFLDAHPMSGTGEEGYSTVLKELEMIASPEPHDGMGKPVLLLHDFQVPGLPEAGWDTYNGQPFTLEWIAPYLDRIYGEGGWKHNYPTEVAGARRGWISIEPCSH